VRGLVPSWPAIVETGSVHSEEQVARRAQAAGITAGATKPEPNRMNRRTAASGWALTEEDIREIDQTTG
jgi:hypothetical protein